VAKAVEIMNENQSIRLADNRQMGFAEYGAGDGAPFFGLHGTPGSRFMFQLADARAKELGLRLIAPERPGCGLSTPQPNRSLTGWARDIAELADHLKIERFALTGVSGGGPYTAACAAHLGERVTHAAFISPIGPVGHEKVAASLSRFERRIYIDIARSNWRSNLMFRAMRWNIVNAPTIALQAVIARGTPSDRAILRQPRVAANLVESFYEGVRTGVDGCVQDLRLFSEPWEFDFSQISARCRIWQGDADTVVPPIAAKVLAGLIPGCEFTRLSGAGHYWVFDHFTDVLEWIAVPELERAVS
jgi:pimeloyl-ACP methyl ester carboxylesterase